MSDNIVEIKEVKNKKGEAIKVDLGALEEIYAGLSGSRNLAEELAEQQAMIFRNPQLNDVTSKIPDFELENQQLNDTTKALIEKVFILIETIQLIYSTYKVVFDFVAEQIEKILPLGMLDKYGSQNFDALNKYVRDSIGDQYQTSSTLEKIFDSVLGSKAMASVLNFLSTAFEASSLHFDSVIEAYRKSVGAINDTIQPVSRLIARGYKIAEEGIKDVYDTALAVYGDVKDFMTKSIFTPLQATWKDIDKWYTGKIEKPVIEYAGLVTEEIKKYIDKGVDLIDKHVLEPLKGYIVQSNKLVSKVEAFYDKYIGAKVDEFVAAADEGYKYLEDKYKYYTEKYAEEIKYGQEAYHGVKKIKEILGGDESEYYKAFGIIGVGADAVYDLAKDEQTVLKKTASDVSAYCATAMEVVSLLDSEEAAFVKATGALALGLNSVASRLNKDKDALAIKTLEGNATALQGVADLYSVWADEDSSTATKIAESGTIVADAAKKLGASTTENLSEAAKKAGEVGTVDGILSVATGVSKIFDIYSTGGNVGYKVTETARTLGEVGSGVGLISTGAAGLIGAAASFSNYVIDACQMSDTGRAVSQIVAAGGAAYGAYALSSAAAAVATGALAIPVLGPIIALASVVVLDPRVVGAAADMIYDVGSAAVNAGEKICNSFDRLANSSGFGEIMCNTGALLCDSFVALGEMTFSVQVMAVEGVFNIMCAAGEVLGDIGTCVGTAIGDAVSAAAEAVGDAVCAIGDAIGDAIGSIGSAISSICSGW